MLTFIYTKRARETFLLINFWPYVEIPKVNSVSHSIISIATSSDTNDRHKCLFSYKYSNYIQAHTNPSLQSSGDIKEKYFPAGKTLACINSARRDSYGNFIQLRLKFSLSIWDFKQ